MFSFSFVQEEVHEEKLVSLTFTFVLDDLESSPERVIIYSGVSQAILAFVRPGEYKMQADALANAVPVLGYGPCEYLPLSAIGKVMLG